ncbi:MAG TPA: hypothetical protein VEI02_03865, partial [Planctomycetota bacterium]|nr:hypothetical protein [Planctomycetota bacterium]
MRSATALVLLAAAASGQGVFLLGPERGVPRTFDLIGSADIDGDGDRDLYGADVGSGAWVAGVAWNDGDGRFRFQPYVAAVNPP